MGPAGKRRAGAGGAGASQRASTAAQAWEGAKDSGGGSLGGVRCADGTERQQAGGRTQQRGRGRGRGT